ncbi:hypothetical protein C8E89_107122 [Mycolicibacterium moriokaense]|uniref:DUF6542 domain-containing protein n=1 Tax=Mycolicibacterium moriokaense TaxID=39691 RepID=A0A318HLW0_9MYCO|nr:hypothetical protein C8E89_107122 [Mycolicibacterium moriokaense]
MLLAVTLTAVGFAFDAGSGDKELSFVFAAAYALGCIFAVLAVRQSGIFTAVIQPPLILFVAVPTSYYLFHGAKFTGIKDTLINFGYPLIERFPLMFFTSAAVLLIGMGRWYYGVSAKRGAARASAKDTSSSRVSSVTSKVSSLLTGEPADPDVDTATEPRRKHTIERPARPARTAKSAKSTTAARSGRTTKRAASSRSRHARPPETEVIEPVAERPRRPRTPRQSEQPPVPPAEPRRRPRSSTREPRKAVPPADRRASYERPERRRRVDDYEPRESHGANGTNGTNGNGTHHPVSRVRYRGDAEDGDSRAEQHRTRPRSSRSPWEADSWEYDV